jgi:GntR family transcriptional repressor for pyruvate dehydrogenase complex
MLDRLDRPRLATAVFDQLLRRIVDGTFPIGGALPSERLLCEELGVSRTAVREALARLAQLKVIAIRHGGETRVLDYRETAGMDLLPALLFGSGRLDTAVVMAGVQMRAVIAPDVARLAAKAASPAAIAELEAICAEMKRSRKIEVLQALSLKFWRALVRASGNVAYQLAFNSLVEGMARIAEQLARAQRAELRDTAGYLAITRALKARDARGAERAARAHLALGLREP